MALRQEDLSDLQEALDQVHHYWQYFVYEYALRREAGLEAREAVRWSLRRILPPPEGLHPAVAVVAGYRVPPDDSTQMTPMLLQAVINAGEQALNALRATDGWQAGTTGMGW
jgi:hypothetical protein